jgi:hypothetical protein
MADSDTVRHEFPRIQAEEEHRKEIGSLAYYKEWDNA